MAKVIDNIFVRGLSGKLGDQVVFRRLRDGRTIVCNKPDFSNRKLSKDQKNHHKRFQAAAAYAKSASRTQPIYDQLAVGTMKNAYNVALGDWFHPPVIHRLERRGKTLRIRASDDVLVLDERGKVKEKGDCEALRKEAIRKKGDWWEYAPVTDGKLVVEARDLAENVTREDEHLNTKDTKEH